MFLAKRELFKKATDTFNGTGSEGHYNTWKTALQTEIKDVPLTAIEYIKVLLANTSSDAHKVVKNFYDASAGDPARALDNIWTQLDTRYGSSIKVASSFRKQLDAFPTVKEGAKLGQQLTALFDLCNRVVSQMSAVPDLQILNFAEGQKPIVQKLPTFLINKWRKKGTEYQWANGNRHPPFSLFVNFLERQMKEYSNEAFNFQADKPSSSKPAHSSTGAKARTLATAADGAENTESTEGTESLNCPMHPDSSSHGLAMCNTFCKLSIDNRREKARTANICFNCLLDTHRRQDCPVKDRCTKCDKDGHHPLVCPKESASSSFRKNTSFSGKSSANRRDNKPAPAWQHGKEYKPNNVNSQPKADKGLEGSKDKSTSSAAPAKNLCTKICKGAPKSCSKTLLVDV